MKRVFSALVFVSAVGFTASAFVRADGNPYAPQPQSSLRQMLSIDWKKGPNLPQGLQDSVVGILDHTLVTAGGFCQGSAGWSNAKELAAKKPGRYPRGFLNKAWALNLDNPEFGMVAAARFSRDWTTRRRWHRRQRQTLQLGRVQLLRIRFATATAIG